MFVKKSNYQAIADELEVALFENDSLMKAVERLKTERNAAEEEVGRLKAEQKVDRELLDDLEDINEKLTAQVSEYEAGVQSNAEKTTATLYISDDLETVTPITKVRAETVNKMVEKGYLPWNKRDDDFAINLAAMLISSEALEQIVFSFESALNEGSSFEGEEDNDDQ